jgi:6-phosphogluconolactonase
VRSQKVRCIQALLAISIIFGLAAPASLAQSQTKLALYAGAGSELTLYDVNAGEGTLLKRSTVFLPGTIQYAWPHPSRRNLYVAWSNGSLAKHGVITFRIDPVSAALTVVGQPVSLAARPIHLTTDVSGTHLLVAYNNPSGVTVHEIAADGSIGALKNQPSRLDVGIYAHQVRVDPSNRTVILVTRGNGPAGDKPEDPGALKIFDYQDGVLKNLASVAPGGGLDFQPRHLDFHPSRPWVFVSLERQNKLQVYEKSRDGTLGAAPLFTKGSLADPGHPGPGQVAGTVHMHPNGRFVYQANRASNITDFEGRSIFAGGENNIAVFAVNQTTGEPVLVQNADTRGLHPRTFALDPAGTILIAANQMSLDVRKGNATTQVPASLALFRVRSDGKLDFARKYDVETGSGKSLMWIGCVALP